MENKDYFDKIDYIIEHLHDPDRLLEEEFLDWLKQDENLSLFNEIRTTREAWLYKKHAGEINTRSEFKKFRKNLFRKKRQIYYWSAAAACCILLIIGIWYLETPHNTELLALQEIPSAKRKAELILPDGERIALENQVAEFSKNNGVVVKDNSAARLIYEDAHASSEEVVYHKLNIPAMADYYIELSDGTKVWLNCESTLKYPVQFNGKERRVFLSGEAFFEVKKTANWPFIVVTDEMNVEVTGTGFNVRAYPQEKMIQTTLVYGEIRINDQLLKPNQQLIFNKETKQSEIKAVDVQLYTGWTEGLFIFRNERLETVIANLIRWYDMNVIYLHASAKDLHFSGSLKRFESIDKILEIIRTIDKVNITRDGKTIIVSTDP